MGSTDMALSLLYSPVVSPAAITKSQQSGTTVIGDGLGSTTILRSTDGGNTFYLITVPAPGFGSWDSVATDGAGTWVMVSGASDDVLRSTDDGVSWVKISGQIGSSNHFSVRWASGFFYTSFGNSLKRSADGATWSTPAGSTTYQIVDIIVVGSRLVMTSGTPGYSAYTDDGGATIHSVSTGMSFGSLAGIGRNDGVVVLMPGDASDEYAYSTNSGSSYSVKTLPFKGKTGDGIQSGGFIDGYFVVWNDYFRAYSVDGDKFIEFSNEADYAMVYNGMSGALASIYDAGFHCVRFRTGTSGADFWTDFVDSESV